ncbi:MAG: cytochrome c nitrite reductase small subunit [Candidatus Kapaibacteriales bacterium]
MKNICYYLPMGKFFKVSYFLLGALFLGISVFGFYISNAVSYLSEDPTACVNCHIMTPHFTTWFHSSHRNVATCNDCHLPSDNPIRRFWFKANDGLRHSFFFTLGKYPQVIRIRSSSEEVVQANCLRCHNHQISALTLENFEYEQYLAGNSKLCWDCHREIPHGRISAQASTPYSIFPDETQITPKWLMNLVNQNLFNNLSDKNGTEK